LQLLEKRRKQNKTWGKDWKVFTDSFCKTGELKCPAFYLLFYRFCGNKSW
jgi:hypothetical protein